MDNLKWWQQAVFYQIYPRSFADGNGDGIGDFPGMIAKLDYLQELGIDALWLSPHYPSPFLDCGYDISDYTGVGPEYGSLADFTTFLKEAHVRGIRVILDLVLNHTSDQHPWFLESRSSRTNPKRDWYMWHDGKNDGPPNNWVSGFGGSAWEYDATTQQYYYHFFIKEQPDLNWRNPEVKQAMWDAVRFWLDLGVDGFRLDAIATIFEDPSLPDSTATMNDEELLCASVAATTEEERQLLYEQYQQLLRFQIQQPGIHELMQELRSLLDEYPGDRVLVGEEEDIAYHGSGDNELHLVFNFPLMRVGRLTPAHIRANQTMRLAELPPGAWPCNTLGNHDVSRVWSAFGDGSHDAELARLHMALVLLLKGTPFLYNGEEIGMTNLELTDLRQFRDTPALIQYRTMIQKCGMSTAEALKAVAVSTRDRTRTPMQWRDAPNGGFSPPGVATWLPVNPNYAAGVNVADQEDDPASLLNFYRRMLLLRRATPALIGGDYQALHPQSEAYFAFLRHDQQTKQICLIILNFSAEAQSATFDLGGKQPRLLFSSHKHDQPLAHDRLDFAPFEIFVAELG